MPHVPLFLVLLVLAMLVSFLGGFFDSRENRSRALVWSSMALAWLLVASSVLMLAVFGSFGPELDVAGFFKEVIHWILRWDVIHALENR